VLIYLTKNTILDEIIVSQIGEDREWVGDEFLSEVAIMYEVAIVVNDTSITEGAANAVCYFKFNLLMSLYISFTKSLLFKFGDFEMGKRVHFLRRLNGNHYRPYIPITAATGYKPIYILVEYTDNSSK
jgi:hypothetical protein